MFHFIYRFAFLIASLYFTLRTIPYAIFEWKEQKNHYGASCAIIIALFSLIASNILVWQT